MKKLLLIFLLFVSVASFAQNTLSVFPPVASGTDTYTVTITGAPTTGGVSAMSTRMYFVKFTNANTGAATLNVNSLGADDLQKWNGSSWVALEAGDIAAGAVIQVNYDGTRYQARTTAGGGGAVQSVTGDGVDNTDPQNPVINLTDSRTVTGADAIEQSDNLHVIYFDSATPFDFTIDELDVNTQVALINVGAGDVTFINGAGVTYDGASQLDGGNNNSALVIYKTGTEPLILAGSGGTSVLTDGHIFVGDASNEAADVAMSGEATIANTGAVTLSNSAVIGKVLTGYTSGAGTVAATDNILQAIQKLNGNDATKWSLASGGTLTGSNTITSNTQNQLNFGGTFTATANNAYYDTWGGTLTARSTASDVLYYRRITPTLVASAATQQLIAFDLSPTFTPGAFSPTQIALRSTTGRWLVGTSTPFGSSTTYQFQAESGVNNMFRMTNASNATAHLFRADGVAQIGGGSGVLAMTSTDGATESVSGTAFRFANTAAYHTTNGVGYFFLQGNATVTTSTTTSQIKLMPSSGNGFQPSSGAHNFVAVDLLPTINQTGTASGTITGVNYNPTLTGILGTHYGILIQPSGAKNSFGAGATPTAKVHIGAGSATAGTAPLKFTAGTNLTTTEAGAIEFDGTNLYFTATNGGSRQQLNGQSSGLLTSSNTFTNTNYFQSELGLNVSGATTRRNYEILWIDVSGTTGADSKNLFNGYTDAVAKITISATAVNSTGSEAYTCEKIYTLRKDGSADATVVDDQTIYEYQEDGADLPTVTLDMNSNFVRVNYDAAETHRWTIWAKIVITQL